ncbi:MAG: hypothetical protein ACRCTY_01710 [Candidatus Adiutrix sp.]
MAGKFMQDAQIFAKKSQGLERKLSLSLAALVFCFVVPAYSLANAKQEVIIRGAFSPEPVEKIALENPMLPYYTEPEPAATEQETPSIEPEPATTKQENPQPKKLILTNANLGKHQSITVTPFTFTGINANLIAIGEGQLQEHFSMSMQNAFIKKGFVVKMQSPALATGLDSEAYPHIDQLKEASEVQDPEELKADNATIFGEVYSIHVSPINAITIAGTRRMNARVEISGRAIVTQETSSARLITNKTFAGVSNVNKTASDDLEIQADLYTAAVKQALDECASNLVRALIAP